MKSLKRYEKLISEISDERDNGDGIWVYLKKDYADFNFDPFNPTRQIHEQTVTQLLTRFGKKRIRKINDSDLIKFPFLNS